MNRIKKALADCVKQEPIDYELKAKLDAFSDLKTILFEPERWTVSEHATYFGFFCWGWKYAKKPYAAPVSAKAIRAEDYIKAYQQGRKDMKEEAAKVCDDIGFEDNGYGCAAAIRSME